MNAIPHVEPARTPRGARRAVSSFFLVAGVSMATWSVMVPFIKIRLSLDEASLGTILFLYGIGAIVATPLSSRLIRRYGSRLTVVVASAAQCVILPLLSLAPSSLLLSVLLFGFGALGGIAGVAMNAQALLVQVLGRRSMMSSFHALYSVGGLVGAGLTGLLLQSGLSIELCGGLMATALFVLGVTQYAFLLPKGDEAGPSTSSIKVPPAAILVVGMMTFSFFLAEGAVLDWGAVFLRFFRGYDPANAGFGYAAFSVAMATGRLLGDRIVNRLGAVRVVGGGAIVGATGFLVLVVGPGSASGLVGCALIGIGASNVVPTLISASARISDMPAGAAVSTVVAMGYCGLIAGPAIIGYIAQATSVPIALATMAALLLVVGAGSRVVREGQEAG